MISANFDNLLHVLISLRDLECALWYFYAKLDFTGLPTIGVHRRFPISDEFNVKLCRHAYAKHDMILHTSCRAKMLKSKASEEKNTRTEVWPQK